MIEIIQEENWGAVQDRRGLPKNIKQIGMPDMGDRIYVENSAYQKMHPFGQGAEKMVYVMLGRFDDFAGCACVFVEDVVKMNEIEFAGKLPIWNEDSWGYLYRKLRPEHEQMIIVGWAIDICGQLPSMTAQLERIHQTYFGGVHQILFLMDTLEKEEFFYSNHNGYLKRREGFYVYYDKSIPGRMESAMESLRAERRSREEKVYIEDNDEALRRESYREYLNRKNSREKAVVSHGGGSFSTTFLLLLLILGLGYSSYYNHEKMEQMEMTLSRMDELQAVMQTEVEADISDGIIVEEVQGSITTAETENWETQEIQTEMAEVAVSVPETETEVPVLSEADTYLQQGYYTVCPGDSLVGICQKIYHTTAMMDQLCELNGIDDPDAIYVGQNLKLLN